MSEIRNTEENADRESISCTTSNHPSNLKSLPRQKLLSEMTLEELWQLFPIQLTEYCDCWPEWFEEERKILQPLLPKESRISHIGSTAVPGIWAKPIVDILAELPADENLENTKKKLTDAGYLCMSESPARVSLNKGYTENGFAERVFHIHLRYFGDNDELYFRKYLREHPETAEAYEKLKLSLWKEYEHDRDGYTEAKGTFVARVTELARAEYPDYY